MNNIWILIMDGFLIILLLFVMSAFARREKMIWAFFIMGIELILLSLFLIDLYFNSIYIFLVLILYIVLIGVLGSKNYYKLGIKDIEIQHKSIKEDIVVSYIADLQFDKRKGSYNEKAFNNMVNRLSEYKSDLILMGGDYVNYKEHIDIFIKNLKQISATNKVISVLGNHDNPWLEEITTKMQGIGIRNLFNEYENVNIKGQDILVVGLEDYWTGNPKYPQIKDEDKDFAKLVLLHNPDDFKTIVDEKFDIALAGHYHRGQVNLIPHLYLARIITKYTYGMYKIGKNKMYVSSGIGGTFLRGYISGYIRWNAPAEIVKITIKKAKE